MIEEQQQLAAGAPAAVQQQLQAEVQERLVGQEPGDGALIVYTSGQCSKGGPVLLCWAALRLHR